jgi:hypothetical protein
MRKETGKGMVFSYEEEEEEQENSPDSLDDGYHGNEASDSDHP